MKVSSKNSANKGHISNLKSQIQSSGDLRMFDEFLAKGNYFDFSNDEHWVNARISGCHPTCCGGQNITISLD